MGIVMKKRHHKVKFSYVSRFYCICQCAFTFSLPQKLKIFMNTQKYHASGRILGKLAIFTIALGVSLPTPAFSQSINRSNSVEPQQLILLAQASGTPSRPDTNAMEEDANTYLNNKLNQWVQMIQDGTSGQSTAPATPNSPYTNAAEEYAKMKIMIDQSNQQNQIIRGINGGSMPPIQWNMHP